MTVSLAIKHNEIIIRRGTPYRYAFELPLNRLTFMPLLPDDGAEFSCSEDEFMKLLGKREIRMHGVLRDAEGNIVAESDGSDLDPTKEDSKKE
jgi:hypothetical protein